MPTYAETWWLLSDGDRGRLAELDQAQTEILNTLSMLPADEVEAPMFNELQVERLHVYRAAHERTRELRTSR